MKVLFLDHAMVITKGFIFNRNSDFVCFFCNLEGEELSNQIVVCSEN